MPRPLGPPRSRFEQRVRHLMAAQQPALQTYAQLARQTAIPHATLQAMFRLEKRPTANQSTQLAKSLGVDIHELLQGTENGSRLLQYY